MLWRKARIFSAVGVDGGVHCLLLISVLYRRAAEAGVQAAVSLPGYTCGLSRAGATEKESSLCTYVWRHYYIPWQTAVLVVHTG